MRSVLLGVVALVAGVLVAPATALAAGEQVNIWLTTTSDSGGRVVTRGLRQQQPVNFQPGNGSGPHGPHNGGCGTCTGLLTVHNGDGQHGQVTYEIEYYSMGHLTKFVKPGAVRIDTNDSSSVRNVAWRNPDGSKALIAHNTTGSTQSVRVNRGNQSFTYNLPTKTAATFTWTGTPGNGGGTPTSQITGLGGKCVAGAATANGTAVQLYDCNGTTAQQWTVGSDGSIRALGKCLDVSGASTADGGQTQLWDCNGTGAQRWTVTSGRDVIDAAANKCLDATGNSSVNGTRLQIWSCTGGANQKWVVPTS